ncbi:MAG: MFS transporter [Clostridia bacterium]|nr:MFS transporter [Clostridia bacterium]
MSTPNFKRTKLACYAAYFTMSSIFSLPPLLFVTLREMYGISYTLLGTLVLTNFFTQLTIDLIFTCFSKYFQVKKIVRIMPLITTAGLTLYALSPTLFPNHVYLGLLLGTITFSVSAGLSEVLLSPVIAAIPSDNPQRDMSALHSLYAFGVCTVVIISTLFLKLFGAHNWQYLTVFMAALPIIAAVLFMLSPMPEMNTDAATAGSGTSRRKTVGLALCTACIFLGSCAENTMSNWISGYMENALHLDKALGDILGMAMFAILLGIARISYARFGKNIIRVLMLGMVGAAICYLTVGLTSNTILAFVACIFTGLFTSMLWPGTLIMMEEKIPGVGVAAYALMASGGDLGASVAPQLMGIVIDRVTVSNYAVRRALETGLTPEQIGMQTGMLVTSLFPIAGMILLLFIVRYFKKKRG